MMMSDHRDADHSLVERGRKLTGGLALLACVAALGVAATSAAAASGATSTIAAADALESQVLVELNAIRRKHGLAPLRLASSLSAAADLHSRTMGRYGYFGHESRDGSAFGKRVQRFYSPRGYGSWSVGENLLWASPALDAREALRRWMASPGHRKNILTAGWREIGLSAVTVERAPGVYGSRKVTIITTDFGARS